VERAGPLLLRDLGEVDGRLVSLGSPVLLYDLPEVIAAAPAYLAEAGVAGRVEVVSGSCRLRSQPLVNPCVAAT
jgi:hypothetical protein